MTILDIGRALEKDILRLINEINMVRIDRPTVDGASRRDRKAEGFVS
ncbi:MAG: hypothetical protein U5R46_19560 [Gammaproteobacteria bacterium]|nr:hypothetical protein [Gammaproteobacteria bacterium]